MNIKETLAKMKTDEEMTYGELLGPAMAITEQAEATGYLTVMIERSVRLHEMSAEEAEKTCKANLGYFAGYSDTETRRRVNDLFAAVHPIFGNDFPTAAAAFQKGIELGEAAKS